MKKLGLVVAVLCMPLSALAMYSARAHQRKTVQDLWPEQTSNTGSGAFEAVCEQVSSSNYDEKKSGQLSSEKVASVQESAPQARLSVFKKVMSKLKRFCT